MQGKEAGSPGSAAQSTASDSDPGSRDFALISKGENIAAEQQRQAGQGGAQLEASTSGRDHVEGE
jgi:hypothetical protein